MTWAAAWPRRWTAGLLAGLLPLFGAFAIVVGAGAGRAAGTILAEAHDVDAVAPSRVVPVRHPVASPPQLDPVDPPSAVVDSGPPRRADVIVVAVPDTRAEDGVSVPADPPDQRGPPPLSTP
ncbi:MULTISPECIES: hypothetical protein [Actinokineospora]|uniref:Uncharacterized protein n=1 Tax=Actinokineospora fastidiosa TaxID=1816 RepID=A0A918LCJ2_9PSEU|nr:MULTISPECIES: hypothetical protein [Actinokineospora]UVS79891.1 hypothetical protein Actkin_03641 [Actinokineospora sp. UTMC 2448]GGS31570.1 hypothetical protein GCM10010171_26810 [Actinokineospora fastidiosa]